MAKIDTAPLDNDKDQPINGTRKIDHELYNEKDNIVHKLVRIKREHNLLQLFQDNELCMVIDVNQLSSKYKAFLQTADGMSWLLKTYKKGKLSEATLEKELKAVVG
jgi:hypothetical protein